MHQRPLLQHALARWWRVAESIAPDAPNIDAGATQTVGDVSTALDRHAESLYAALSAEDRAATEALFRAITEGRSGDEAIRRPQRLAAIAEWTGLPVEALKPLIETFAAPDVSFVHYGHDLTERSVIDLTHEALIRQWQRLRDWVASERQRGEYYRRWSARANEYAAGRGALLVGGELAGALEWWNPGAPAVWTPSAVWAVRYSDAKGVALSAAIETIMHFVADSRDATDQAFDAERRQLEARAEAERQRADSERALTLLALSNARRTRRMSFATALLATIAVLLAIKIGQSLSVRAAKEITDVERKVQKAEAAREEVRAVSAAIAADTRSFCAMPGIGDWGEGHAACKKIIEHVDALNAISVDEQ